MNWADYCILATLGISVLIGLLRGFVREAMALAGWVLAFWAAWAYGDQLAAWFTAISLPSARLLVGYAVCFIAVLVVCGIIGMLLHKLIAGSGLSGSDRMLGMVFGLLRGLAVVTLTILLLGFTPLPRDPWWHQSQLLPTFQGYAQWLSARLPPDVTKHLDLRGLLPHLNPAATRTGPKPAAPRKVVPKSAEVKPAQHRSTTNTTQTPTGT